MKKIIIAIAIILLFAGNAFASGTSVDIPSESGLHLISSENISVLTTGVTTFTALSAANQAKVREMHIYLSKGDSVRWNIDGTSPTTTLGPELATGNGIVLKGLGIISKFRAITISTGSGSSLFALFFGK